MSWETFKTPLVARIVAVSGVGKVYPYWPLSSDSSIHPKFKAMFEKDGALNFWAIQRAGFSREKCPDDDSHYLVTHDVRIAAIRAFQGPSSEASFQTVLDAVSSDFRSGDRTLGGIVNTLSVPDFREIAAITFASSVVAHGAEASFRVEEIES